MRVELAPDARDQLRAIYRYIAETSNPATARDFTEAILARCRSLATFPERGTPRDDVRPGLRTMAFRRRVVITFDVKGDVVRIAGIFYGGRDFASHLADGNESEA